MRRFRLRDVEGELVFDCLLVRWVVLYDTDTSTMFTIPSPTGNEIATTGLQNDQSGTITMIVDDMFPFPGDIDLFSANTKCGYIFMFNTGGPPANHSMTLLFKGASTSAPDQRQPQFHLASISCVQYVPVCDSLLTYLARC